MNDNKNLVNVLEKINSNKIPLIILIIALILIIFIVIYKDYNTFRENKKKQKLEGFNSDDAEQKYDYYREKYNETKKNYDYVKDNISYIKNKVTDYKNEFNNISNKISNSNEKIKNAFNIKNWNVLPKDNKLVNSIIILSFVIIIIILSFIFLPSFENINKFFIQIYRVTYVILYTIFIILFFRLLPENILNSNANYIVPITIIIGFILFVYSFQGVYIEELGANFERKQIFDINYERIKMIILYFCFITLCITYYTINPGGFITKNFNITLLLSGLLGVFGFMYLFILLTFTNSGGSFSLENLSAFSKYGSLLFILFLIVITIIITNYPGGFFKNNSLSTLVISLLSLVCILWATLLIINMYPNKNNTFTETNLSNIKKSLLILFGLIISGIIVTYIVLTKRYFSNKSSIPSFILSLFLIISILILIYKTIFVRIPFPKMNKTRDSFFELLINVLFYIPCLFSGVFDSIMKLFISEYNSNSYSTYLILIVLIVLICLYFLVIPLIQSSFNKQGGKQLIENPINTNNLQVISNYKKLNNKESFDYQYGLSFWVFLESSPPNTNVNYNKFTSLINYGGKPNILYKADTNKLMITMEQEQLSEKGTNKLIEYDENGNRIIYINNNFLLQKWNNLVINYNGGTLDIFLNGELVKSSIEVVPYMKYDNLTVGNQNGVNGGVCNMIYFNKPLTLTNIYYIYNNLKNSNPPVINYYNKTILQ